jgi:hypothetical protein
MTTRTTTTRRRSEGDAAATTTTTAAATTTTTTARRGLHCDGADYLDSINANGFPQCYSCTTDRPAAHVQLVRVAYDYEVAWDDSANDSSSQNVNFVQDILPPLEWGQLITVATQFHLPSCQLARQEPSAGSDNDDDDDDLVILGVSSLYLDFRDVQVAGCEFLPTSGDASSHTNDDDYACTPVAGSMTAEYTGGNAALATARLLAAVEAVMAENHGIRGPVKDLLFVGNRQAYRASHVAGMAADKEAERNGAPITSLVTSAAAAGCIALVVAGLALWVHRKRRHPKPRQLVVGGARGDEENPVPPERTDKPHDVELPSSPTRSPTTSDADLPDTDEVSMVPLEDVPPSYLPPAVVVVVAAAVGEGMIMEPLSSNNNNNLVLKSETLRKHRKRKKRKTKKVTLVRVNSRENISSMETISETDEAEPLEDLDAKDFTEGIAPSITYTTSDDESSVEEEDSIEAEEVVEPPPSGTRSPRRTAPGLPPLPPVAI